MAMRWRYLGGAIGCVAEMITVDVTWRPLSIFAFLAAGLALGELAERIWRGQLGTSQWSFSLRTLLILSILGPPALAWGYLEWRAWQQPNRAELPDPGRTIEEILNDSAESNDVPDTDG